MVTFEAGAPGKRGLVPVRAGPAWAPVIVICGYGYGGNRG